MQPAICLLAVIPMRKEAAHRSEMVSQLLFGEYVIMGEEKDDFVFVTCAYDGYQGWVQQSQLKAVQETERLQTTTYTTAFATPVSKNKTLLYVPSGTPVFGQHEFTFNVAGFQITYLLQPQQTWRSNEFLFSQKALEAAIQPYLNAPYLWGGKSVFGIDCSGFVQQVFKLFGVTLLRDAYQQAEQGEAVPSVAEARPGDLAFFCNDAGRVTHVGIVLDGGKIVHASGEVRIDVLSKEGIVIAETGRQTHVLHSIRRTLVADKIHLRGV